MTPPTSRSRHLVDAALAPLLDLFPTVALDDDNLAAARAQGFAFPPPPPEATAAVARERRTIPGPSDAPDVPVEIYRPAAEGLLPCILHMHGGGFVAGEAAMLEPVHTALAYDQSCVIVSVDYRLAPETRSPGAVEDGYAALTWLVAHAEELGVARDRVGVMVRALAEASPPRWRCSRVTAASIGSRSNT